MTSPVTTASTHQRRPLQSAAAVFLGFLAVVVLSLGSDQVLHMLDVYPPWGDPMYDPGLNFLALGYRSIYTIVGGYLTARLAPQNPMRHVLALAVVGFVAGLAGAMAASPMDLGPDWYPIALALSGPLFVWLGGVLYRRRQA